MSYEIVTDSASNLTDDIIEKFDLKIISYSGTINGKIRLCYEKGEDFVKNAKTFYEAMRNNAEVKTTLVNSESFIEMFDPILKNGSDVLFIGMSSGLTGTIQSANMAAEELTIKYPERKCIVVDSLSASLGEGLLVCHVSEMRSEGKSIDEVVKWMVDNRLKMSHIFTVNDLVYLKRGGRISATVNFIGTLLNMKPILKATDDGIIALTGKVRGRLKALNTLVESFINNAQNPENQTIGIAHCDCEEDANYVASSIRAACKVKDIIIRYYDLCTGTHVGPGTVALFFMANNAR